METAAHGRHLQFAGSAGGICNLFQGLVDSRVDGAPWGWDTNEADSTHYVSGMPGCKPDLWSVNQGSPFRESQDFEDKE